ncbi:tetratricopeptide (TPR) repeat protein [Nocardia transvalensis]|uniref:Tetratricopeptide (TPR) repeat protein n=1 Tax=Nocardia transvalensis TaxID=37333 RepID=A0A7W9PIZ4_9NOCA|nr:tetratricopeptide repeat protein [Nocardia transvalensis]MBB5916971.1 tetratricopeptide (TPR) repeat protein [Nocardia transvalensis]
MEDLVAPQSVAAVTRDELTLVRNLDELGDLIGRALAHSNLSYRKVEEIASRINAERDGRRTTLNKSVVGDMRQGRRISEERLRLLLFICQVPRDQLAEWLAAFRCATGQAVQTTLTVFGKIPDEPQHYVARAQLHEVCEALNDTTVVTIVTGMRGAGKTQLAAAYARQLVASRSGLVAWVNAETVDSLISDYAEIAERLGISKAGSDAAASARWLRDHLSTHSSTGLLVLDNASNLDDLRPFIPFGEGLSVVVTTTNRAFCLLGVTVDAANGFTRQESVQYLCKATDIDDQEDAHLLAEELGDLPLALSAAAATIKSRHLSYSRYLELLRIHPLPRALRRREGHDHPYRVDQAILLSIDTVESASEDIDLDNAVRWTLGVISMLDPSGVPRELLNTSEIHSELLIEEALERCVQGSLLLWSASDDVVTMHRLTARVVRERAAVSTETIDILVGDALGIIEPYLPTTDELWSYRDLVIHLADQVESIWTTGLPDLASAELRTRSLTARRWVCRQLLDTADTARTARLTATALADHERLLGPDHTDTDITRSFAAHAQLGIGRPAEAVALYEASSRIRDLASDDPQVLSARNNLAVAYQDIGLTEKAIAIHEELVAAWIRIHGNEHPEVLLARNNLAHSYNAAGRESDAFALYAENLRESIRVLGHEHPDVVLYRNNFATVCVSVGGASEAVDLHRQNLSVSERIFGNDHPSTLTCRRNLVMAYSSASHLDQALELGKSNLDEAVSVLGPEHVDVLGARNDLAYVYCQLDRVDVAIELYQRNLCEAERILGDGYPLTQHYRDRLADAYILADRYAEAVAEREKNLAHRIRRLDATHPNVLDNTENLVFAYVLNRQHGKAISLAESSLDDCVRVLGGDHVQALRCRRLLVLANKAVATDPRK